MTALDPTGAGPAPGRDQGAGPPLRPPRKRNPRGQGARLRDEIIQGAAAILERTGNEESITLRAVAREVGIAPPSMSRCFADRAEVIDAVVAQELGALSDAIVAAKDAEADPVEQLFAIVRAYYAHGHSHPNRYRVIFERRFLPLWEDEGRAMDQTAPLIAETFGLVVTTIERCVESGRSSSADPFADATALWFAIHGLVTLPPTVPSFPWPDADELLVACVTRLIRLNRLN
jgi:AcrR family transcriptional regulator